MPQAQPQPLLNYFPDEDGYTLPAYIDGVKLLTGPVRLRFRPTEQLERAVLMEVNASNSERNVSKRFAEVLAVKITEWDMQMMGNDNVMLPMPLNSQYMLRLKPALWIRLINIVLWGVDGGDVDPNTPIEETAKQVDDDFEAILKGQKLGDARLDTSRKN